MFQVILWNVQQWDADITTMSFGLRGATDHRKRDPKVSRGDKDRILFAAASNDGGNSGWAYPAKDFSVICIHSTDGGGNKSGFNPSPEDYGPNFSLLGNGVRSTWPANVDGHVGSLRRTSGTSISTPIAAAIAASILVFVRGRCRPGHERWVKKLRSSKRNDSGLPVDGENARWI
jgi:hypothetical protein